MDNNEYVYPQDHPDGVAGLARGGGLTLRDYFAAQALTGMRARSGVDGRAVYYARLAYEQADEMLKARQETPNG